jgi:hypothetical protein
MTIVGGIDRPGRGQRLRAAGQRLFGEIAGRYRNMKRRLAELLLRGDRDYATLTALSQELGRMRQRIRADLQRRREAKKSSSSAASKATLPTLGGRRRQEP